jgi:hypothetical protein
MGSNLQTLPLTVSKIRVVLGETDTAKWLFPQGKATLYTFPSTTKTLILL